MRQPVNKQEFEKAWQEGYEVGYNHRGSSGCVSCLLAIIVAIVILSCIL